MPFELAREDLVAQLRFRAADGRRMLNWPDCNSRWHEYNDLDPREKFEDLLPEVDRDRTGILWG